MCVCDCVCVCVCVCAFVLLCSQLCLYALCICAQQSSTWRVYEPMHVSVYTNTEMMKAGLIDEMMNDTLDSALDTEDMEEESENQIAQV